ncbi:MAG TPA: hypothetical protein VHQ94_06215 [Pyrinomonadaceae bacterium]|jgi:hypothetical protein|nr:hypothetical protein [Pyrinomonadaceae bacterium]
MFRLLLLLFLVLTLLPLGNRAATNGGGTIAYVRNGTEVRLGSDPRNGKSTSLH